MAAVVNSTFASPIANADYLPFTPTEGGFLSRVYNGMSGLSITITLLLILVAYDQCESAIYLSLGPAADTWDS